MAVEFVSGFILSSLLQEFVDRIKASAADKIALACSSDVEEELKSLEVAYMKAQSMLDNVDGWDLITSKSHRHWVADVRRACYDVEDFTEHMKLEIIKKKGETGILMSYWTRWGVSSRIHDLQTNLNKCADVAEQFVASHCRLTDQKTLNTEPIIALDDDKLWRKPEKEDIIKVLLRPTSSSSSSSNRSSSSIVLIAGMFGLGKTTLIHAVKNDSRVKCHYDHRVWVSVAGDFNLGEVLCSMILDLQLELIQGPDLRFSRQLPEHENVRTFQRLCKGKKVLVVLDDVCNFVKLQDWDDFHSVILSSSTEFGVLITTRNPNVSTIVASVSSIPTVCHYLKRLSDEHCGLILQREAFSGGDNPSKRDRSGRKISEVIALQLAEKFCCGLPLMANVIGRHISMKLDDRWPVKLSGDYWEIPEFRELIFPTFRLNYSNLSLFLKNSFPYFSLFPNGYSFKKDELIRLWVAEGYIKPLAAGVQFSENLDLEELGSYYFNEVLSRSILQIYHPFDQEPLIYQMHEVIHRYARCVGSDLYVQLDDQFADASCSGKGDSMLASSSISSRFRNTRHLSLLCGTFTSSIWKLVERHCECLRTILSLQDHICIDKVSYTFFLKLQSLRVLNLSGTDIRELPESLGKLEHIWLLDVSKTDIQELPLSTGDLYNLRFLKVDRCPQLLQLPKSMKNLAQLIHLEADLRELSSMPPNIGMLSNLQTLPAFIAGKKDGYRVTELKNMKCLQGSFCLTDLENVKDEVEAKGAALSNKPFLKKLELEWNRYSLDQSVTEKILGGFEPHENLMELQVTGYDGTRFPSWLSNPECNLTSIHLLRCGGCSELPALGQLQHLKSLHIEELHLVRCIDSRFSGSGVVAAFSSLESLKLQDLTSLEKWQGLEPTQMPCLRDLVICDCPNMISLPSLEVLTSLVNLEISCCPVMQTLPENGLPPSIETLIIVRSDLLKEQCLPESGEWKKIKDIPKVVIDYVHVSQSGHLC